MVTENSTPINFTVGFLDNSHNVEGNATVTAPSVGIHTVTVTATNDFNSFYFRNNGLNGTAIKIAWIYLKKQ